MRLTARGIHLVHVGQALALGLTAGVLSVLAWQTRSPWLALVALVLGTLIALVDPAAWGKRAR